jgi:hypothetical protein
MEQSGKLYGIQHINKDAIEVQRSLATNVSQFLAAYRELIPEDANLRFQWNDPAKALAGEARSEDWSRWTFNVLFHLHSKLHSLTIGVFVEQLGDFAS